MFLLAKRLEITNVSDELFEKTVADIESQLELTIVRRNQNGIKETQILFELQGCLLELKIARYVKQPEKLKKV